jgi:hypothetical protein
VAAENWVLQIERVDGSHVLYRRTKFTAEAERWWISKQDHLQQQLGEAIPITRKNFKEIFLVCFFPKSVRLTKTEEFIDLMQGLISAECYTFKPLNLHMLSSYFCYSLMFCVVFVFSCILQVLEENPSNSKIIMKSENSLLDRFNSNQF